MNNRVGTKRRDNYYNYAQFHFIHDIGIQVWPREISYTNHGVMEYYTVLKYILYSTDAIMACARKPSIDTTCTGRIKIEKYGTYIIRRHNSEFYTNLLLCHSGYLGIITNTYKIQSAERLTPRAGSLKYTIYYFIL